MIIIYSYDLILSLIRWKVIRGSQSSKYMCSLSKTRVVATLLLQFCFFGRCSFKLSDHTDSEAAKLKLSRSELLDNLRCKPWLIHPLQLHRQKRGWAWGRLNSQNKSRGSVFWKKSSSVCVQAAARHMIVIRARRHVVPSVTSTHDAVPTPTPASLAETACGVLFTIKNPLPRPLIVYGSAYTVASSLTWMTS